MRPKGSDRLTDLERSVVKARLANPSFTNFQISKHVGMRGKHSTVTGRVTAILRRPHVQTVLMHPLPEHLPTTIKKARVKVTKKWIEKRVQAIADDVRVPASERLRALKQLAEMTPGVIVPVQMDMKTTFTLEEFVREAGGAPEPARLLQESNERRN